MIDEVCTCSCQRRLVWLIVRTPCKKLEVNRARFLTSYNCTLIDAESDRFLFDVSSVPTTALAAYEIIPHGLRALGSAYDVDSFLHPETRGCLFDFCQQKPELEIKLQAGHICAECTELLLRARIEQRDHEAQPKNYDTIIMPGDTIKTTCTYSKPSLYGLGTQDEMCYDAVLAYPPGSFTQPGIGSGFSSNRCTN